MRGRSGAKDLELRAASAPARTPVRTPPSGSEALAMLVRRGLRPRLARLDLPFPRDLDEAQAERLSRWLGHYGARLFLRGAILAQGPFEPSRATRYLTPTQAKVAGDELVDLGLAVRTDDGWLRLRWKARSFGGTLEWWLARELGVRLALDAVAGVRSGAPGVGGDLDVVAAAEGKLLYVEAKSSPPKHLMPEEVAAFLRRVRALRPHLAILAVDTALRLSDKVLPMVAEAVGRGEPPRRLRHDSWAVAPGLYVVSARPDLVGNLTFAVADGLRELAPEPP